MRPMLFNMAPNLVSCSHDLINPGFRDQNHRRATPSSARGKHFAIVFHTPPLASIAKAYKQENSPGSDPPEYLCNFDALNLGLKGTFCNSGCSGDSSSKDAFSTSS
ncbi:hypothetical protein GUJ93_ZPchr0026g29124 [Zizania palustris]|uniref:Uncharacterized protein n=1 Tax=Zizania palustris TaxID=103762 RepID=A0A8J5QP78_ZIZPA|nr:hypothetical protein GUJ93_ZPchr0026g29124 [Zizania palustris]